MPTCEHHLRALLTILFALALPSAAQQVSHHEIALGIGLSTDTPGGGTPFPTSYHRGSFDNPELRYTFNLNRSVALEGSLSHSIDIYPLFGREGGHQTLALGGIKAGIRRSRFGVFGTSAAGVASFSRGEGIYTSAGSIAYSRITHFALRQGVALEYYPSPRTLLRFDFAELLDAQFSRVFVRTPQYYEASFGLVPYHALASVTVAHRFGKLSTLPALEPAPHPARYSIGGLFVMEAREHLLLSDLRAEGGGGAWLGFPLWRFLSADLVAYDHPHDDHTANVQDGGTTFAAFLGPKLGFHVGRFGLFAKARPGIMRFSRTNLAQTIIIQRNSTDILIQDRPRIDFALDTGLVLEYQPPSCALHHALLRFEGGSTFIHYHGATLAYKEIDRTHLGPPPVTTLFYYAPQRHSSLLFLIGAGYRF